MPLVGDSKAYVFLKKHGALIHELPNHAVILTVAGRVFVITFLLFHGYLTKEVFNTLALDFDSQPELAAYETGKILRKVCESWLTNNKKLIKEHPNANLVPTDLTFSQVSLLLNLLVAGQEDLEREAEGRKVQ